MTVLCVATRAAVLQEGLRDAQQRCAIEGEYVNALADDGSLIVRSTLFFDASRSVFIRHEAATVVWYRFMRTAES